MGLPGPLLQIKLPPHQQGKAGPLCGRHCFLLSVSQKLIPLLHHWLVSEDFTHALIDERVAG